MEIRKKILDQQVKDFDPSTIKAVVIDIDGTLISEQQVCTPRTIKAIENLISSGRHVFIATGRGVKTALPYATECHIPKYMINYNGAVIWDLQKNIREFELCIDLKTAEQIVKIIREENLYSIVYSNDEYYYEIENEESEKFEARVEVKGIFKKFDLLDNSTFQKLIISGSDEKINELDSFFKERFGDQIHTIQTAPNIHKAKNDTFHICLEIMHKKADKGHTLTKLLTMFNISLTETVAFGDDKNDIGMLTAVKWGIAMGNAKSAVREITPYQTLTNDEEGVAYFIEKYILEQE
ncbi:MAG: HAD family hydrolase [Brevinema sp.]